MTWKKEYYPKKVQRTVIQLLAESGKARIAEELIDKKPYIICNKM